MKTSQKKKHDALHNVPTLLHIKVKLFLKHVNILIIKPTNMQSVSQIIETDHLVRWTILVLSAVTICSTIPADTGYFLAFPENTGNN